MYCSSFAIIVIVVIATLITAVICVSVLLSWTRLFLNTMHDLTHYDNCK